MKEKAFLIITPGFASDENDTNCIPSIQSFVKTLSEQYSRLKVIVVATDYPYKIRRYKWNGIDIIALGHNNSKGLLRYIQLTLAYVTIKRLARHYHFEGILSLWGSYAAVLGHYISRSNIIPHLCWLRGQEVKKGNRVMRLFKNHPNELIAISPQINSELNRNYSYYAHHIIPMSVDTSLFQSLSNPGKNIDIIGVGSLIPLKRWDIFLDVVESLVKKFKGLNCMLCGDGCEKATLAAIVQEKNLTNHVQLMGELPHTQILQLMKRSKILLHPSSYEGYAAVFPEALFAGCHCVSFVDPDALPKEHWYIANNKEHMISICEEILQLPETSFFPVEQYNTAQCVHDVMKLYNLEKTA